MNKLEQVFNESSKKAKEELSKLDLKEVHNLGISKTHVDLLGSHTVVTYPPLDSLRDVDGNKLFKELIFQPEVDAYVHIPFCEYPCEFCHYTTLSTSGKDAERVPDYFDALKIEMKTWADKLTEQKAKIRSLYFGGGTPFAIPSEKLEDILSFTRNNLPFTDNPEINVETSPRATIQEDAKRKFEIVKKYGTTRMSVGIQSFDFESLHDMARTFKEHTQEDEEKAVRLLLESGIPNVNIDMIQDLPLKSKNYIERLKNDLLKVAELKPQHVTWYNMRLRPETAYGRKTLKMATDKRMVSEEESLHTRLTIWNFMESIGYLVLEGDRFALASNFEDKFRKTRGSVETDLLGIGVSSYSHVYPGFFQNPRVIGGKIRSDSQRAVDEYINAVNENGHAITYGYHLTDDELLAGKFALGLKQGVSLNEFHEFMLLSPEAGAYNRMILRPSTKLIEIGLLEIKEGKVQFTRNGRLFENEICASFYSPRVVYFAHERRGTLTEKIREDYQDYVISQELDLIASEQKPI